MNEVILLADKDSRAWDFAEKIQKYIQNEKESRIQLNEVVIEHFNNGEINMHVPGNIRQKDVYFVQDSTKNPQEWWIELLLIKDLLLSASAKSVSFVLPNMMYSRKDRKDRPHVPISARTLAKSISSKLDRLITMELHAFQIQGFYPEEVPMDNLHSFPEVVRYLRKNYLNELDNLVLVSPDVGGVSRTKAFLQRLEEAQIESPHKQEYSLALISKIRSRPGEIEEMRLVGDVEGKNVLIIDDMIDTGGTLCKAAELLKQNGAQKLFCYATHGIFTKGTDDLARSFTRIITSNTHHQTGNNVDIIDMSPVFAEAIYRAQKGLSVSKLFE